MQREKSSVVSVDSGHAEREKSLEVSVYYRFWAYKEREEFES